jgi:hypothetical protein
MNIKIEDQEFTGNKITNVNLKTFYNVNKTLNNEELDFIDKEYYIIKDLTDIPVKLLDVADVEYLHQLFLLLTDLPQEYNFQNEVEIEGTFYRTLKHIEKYEDIKINRLQHKIIKRYMEKNDKIYLGIIMSCFFTDGDAIEDNEELIKRAELFNNHMLTELALPFIIKVINMVAVQTTATMDALQAIQKPINI